MTQYPDLFAALAAPFDPSEVKVRAQNNRQLHYVTARTIMNRLDEVLGPENWTDRYVPGENSVLCELTVRLPDGSMLTKSDAGGYAGLADEGDDDKSGYSDAFKRAAVKFGVARYLYRDGVPRFVQERAPRVEPAINPKAPHVELAITPPSAPANGHVNGHGRGESRWGGPRPTPSASASSSSAAATVDRSASAAPTTGKALFAWTKEQEQRHGVGLLKYLNQWAKLQDFPGRMVDWDRAQVELAHAEAVRKLATIESQETES